MGEIAGRTILVKWGSTSPMPTVAGVREKSITLSGEPIDVTNDDSQGWRSLLNVSGTNGVEISVSGILANDVLRKAWFDGADGSGERLAPAEFVYPDGGKVAGDFFLQDYAETGTHEEAATFEATFVSSGVVTYTPGP